ncbi:MAG TPA: hypothetical protein VHM67_05610, partial [Gemmatimonadaceae bacterium]|nr:hypothetical protein [Gemmatimonadaceae bacterium]
PLSAAGPGAGGAPTATAILSDLLAPFESSRAHRPRAAAVADERRLRWLVEAPVGVPALLELFARSELPAKAAGCGPRGSRVIVEAASWRTLEGALGTLDAPEHVATARLEEGVA